MERKSEIKQPVTRAQKPDLFLVTGYWFLVSWLILPLVFAANTNEPKNSVVANNSSEGLEMIAERMKALSASLASIPAPPELNQTIQIPADFSEKEKSPDPKGRHKTEEERT